jgi:hypothetical protein
MVRYAKIILILLGQARNIDRRIALVYVPEEK